MPAKITALITIPVLRSLHRVLQHVAHPGDPVGGHDYPSQNKRVLTVVKTSGEVVEFSKTDPGLVLKDEIRGTARVLVNEKTEIEGPFRQIKRRADGTIAEVTDAKGKVHLVQNVLREEPNRLVVQFITSRKCYSIFN